MGEMPSYFWTIVTILIVLMDIWVITSVFRSEKPSGTKMMWAVLVIVLPVVGVVIWALMGPRGIKRGTGPTSDEHSKG